MQADSAEWSDRTILSELISKARRQGGASWALLGMGVVVVSLGVLALLRAFGATMPGWLWSVVFWMLVGVLGALLVFSSRQQRWALRSVEQASYLIKLMNFSTATAELGWCLGIRGCSPLARATGLIELGQICLAANHSDLAEQAFSSAQRMRASLSAASQWQTDLGLAEAKLRCDQLTDADKLITHLRHQELPQPWQSKLNLLACLQRLYMGHLDDIVAQADDLWHRFREHLGTEAGFGYGLLAAAFDQCGQAQAAGRFWSDATLLIGPQMLGQRYPELKLLTDKYESTQWPW